MGKGRRWRLDSSSFSSQGVALKQRLRAYLLTLRLPCLRTQFSSPCCMVPPLPQAAAKKSSTLMGHIPQATSGGSGHVLPLSTAWGLEIPTPSKPADGGAADHWEKHSLPALPYPNAVETKPLTGTHTPH